MFCSCCGSQNVIGRPSCWRCSTLFSSVTSNNGADQIQVSGNLLGATSCPPPSLSPSETLRFRGAGAANWTRLSRSAAAGIGPAIPKGGSASIAASIAAPSGVLASGGPAGTAGVGIGGVPSGSPVGGQYSFTPGGPRIQGGYIVPTANITGQADARSATRGAAPSNQGAVAFWIHTPKNSSSSNGSSSSRLGNKWWTCCSALRKMDGYQVERLKRMFTRLNIWSH